MQIAEDGKLRLLEPLGYLAFLALEKHAALVITDSGGIQEETTYLGVSCLTARTNTERPVTIIHGTNRLVTSERAALVNAAQQVLGDNRAALEPSAIGYQLSAVNHQPELWDGRAAERIVEVLSKVQG